MFARSLLLIGDGAGRVSVGFCTQRPGLRALNEAKRGLGSSNKGMCSRSLTGIDLMCPAFSALGNTWDRRCFTPLTSGGSRGHREVFRLTSRTYRAC